MYQYKNAKTGAVIQTTGKVTGKNWKLVKESSAKTSDEKPAEEKTGKKGGK